MRVEPGDLVLVASRGRWLALARRMAGTRFDHVAVVTSGGRTLNIDKPSARLLPVERLVRPELQPVVLRPRFRDDAERAAFVAELERLEGKRYDVQRTLALVARLLARRALGVSWRLPRAGWDRERWICTDAVLLALERHVTGFGALRSMPLDWNRIGSGTIDDLVEISRLRPDLLARAV